MLVVLLHYLPFADKCAKVFLPRRRESLPQLLWREMPKTLHSNNMLTDIYINVDYPNGLIGLVHTHLAYEVTVRVSVNVLRHIESAFINQ